MPQIWLTYEELAELFNCDPARARSTAAAIGLDRRKSRDGRTRAKLTAPLAEALLDGVLRQRLEHEIATCAGDLRAMRERMATRSSAIPRLPSVIAS